MIVKSVWNLYCNRQTRQYKFLRESHMSREQAFKDIDLKGLKKKLSYSVLNYSCLISRKKYNTYNAQCRYIIIVQRSIFYYRYDKKEDRDHENVP